MDLIERVESYKVLFKECKALEPVSMALAKGYKSATPLQRLEIIRELDTELAEVYSVEIPVITAWVRDDNYVHSTKEIFLGEPSLEGFLHQFRHHLQNKARKLADTLLVVSWYVVFVGLLIGGNKEYLRMSTGYAVLSRLKAGKPEKEIARWEKLER